MKKCVRHPQTKKREKKKNFIDFCFKHLTTMPKIRTTRTKRAPEGFDEIEPTLEEFSKKMKEGIYSLDP